MSLFYLYLNTENTQWKLTRDKSFSIDDFESYLSQFTPLIYEKGQYFKNQYQCELKIALDESYIQPKNIDSIRYVKIHESKTNTNYYYFVDNVIWRSANSIQLNLTMDVLNTFKPNRDYYFSNKTKINRQHKNRIKKLYNFVVQVTNILPVNLDLNTVIKKYIDFQDNDDNTQNACISIIVTQRPNESPIITLEVFDESAQKILYNTIGSEYLFRGDDFSFKLQVLYPQEYFIRNIDYLSEGINPILYKEEQHNSLINQHFTDWYLLYRNRNQLDDLNINPVDLYIIANKQLRIVNKYKDGINANNVKHDIWYTFPMFKDYLTRTGDKQSIVIYTSPNNIVFIIDPSAETASAFSAIQFKYDSSQQIFVYNAYINNEVLEGTFESIHFMSTSEGVQRESIEGFTTFKKIEFDSFYGPNILKSDIKEYVTMSTNDYYHVNNTIDDVDRTDSQLIKIIKLPYCPFNFKYLTRLDTNSVLIEFEDYSNIYFRLLEQYENEKIETISLSSLNNEFKSTFKTNGYSFCPQNFLKNFEIAKTIDYSSLRDDYFESKIFHSDFYQEKFVYDSFGFSFALERINLENNLMNISDTSCEVNFVVTRTINSRFLFEFPTYTINKLSGEDYDNILPVARNNEITLYNNQYINYIRNGYNYDVKTKEREDLNAWSSVLFNTIASFTSFASGNPIGVASGIKFATRTAQTLINAITGTQQREQNIEAKQQQLKSQSTSVSGSDDVDLMSYYSKNKAKWVTYKVSDIMKKALLDMFFYLGYADNILAIPDLNTRTRFNFIACDVIYESTTNMSLEIIDKLSELYAGGVTFIHNYGGWDIDQQYENFEIDI